MTRLGCPTFCWLTLSVLTAASGCAQEPGNPPGAPLPETVRASVVRAAAATTGVDAANVRIVEATRVTWNDGSLGCPRAGQTYTQALEPGFRVIVAAGGQSLEYHANERGYVVHCMPGTPAAPAPIGTVER